jgi:hypothetical protein
LKAKIINAMGFVIGAWLLAALLQIIAKTAIIKIILSYVIINLFICNTMLR